MKKTYSNKSMKSKTGKTYRTKKQQYTGIALVEFFMGDKKVNPGDTVKVDSKEGFI